MREHECPLARVVEPAYSEAVGAWPDYKWSGECLHGAACPEARGMLNVTIARGLTCCRCSVTVDEETGISGALTS